MMDTTIRLTAEQFDLLESAARHCGLTISDVLRRVARSLELRPMSHNPENSKCVTKMELRARFRGEIPDTATLAQFRARLVEKCTQALRARRAPVFATDKVEGRDYIVKEAQDG